MKPRITLLRNRLTRRQTLLGLAAAVAAPAWGPPTRPVSAARTR